MNGWHRRATKKQMFLFFLRARHCESRKKVPAAMQAQENFLAITENLASGGSRACGKGWPP